MPDVSVAAVVLTYNRPQSVRKLVAELAALGDALAEIIVVDNHSEAPCAQALAEFAPPVRVLRTDRNEGTAARNHGIRLARSDVVVTLDDDLFGLTRAGVDVLKELFRDGRLGAVSFKVLDPETGRSMNWCHPRSKERFANERFATDEISEGAVAFKRSAVIEAGLYPDSFFISHEGPDLAFRLLGLGCEVRYDPRIAVYHAPAPQGRPSWRRYYFDGRNVFWLAARNLPLGFGLKRIVRQVGALGVYALRDGQLRPWARGIYDGLAGLKTALAQRRVLDRETMRRVREIERHRPGVLHWLRHRLFRRGVEI